jgi:hypothetical protein
MQTARTQTFLGAMPSTFTAGAPGLARDLGVVGKAKERTKSRKDVTYFGNCLSTPEIGQRPQPRG